MASKDLKTCLDVQPSILPQAAAADATGSEVDTLGFESVTLIGSMDGTAVGSFKIQETDTSGSGYADVADADVITSDGTNDTAGVQSANVTIGYIGDKRYVRAFWTHSTTGDVSSVIALGNPHVKKTGANS